MASAAHSLFCTAALLPDGWADAVRIVIASGRIVAVQRSAVAREGDEHVACLLPGIGNVHSHAFQRGMAGLAEHRGPDDDGFWSWRDVMYRFVDRLVPEQVRAIAALAYLEMLESGFTRVGEFHYLHHDPDGRRYAQPALMSEAIVQAAQDTGIGLTLLPVLYCFSGFGAQPARPEQRRFTNDLDGYVRLVEDVQRACVRLADPVIGVAPHSLRAVSPQQLRTLTTLLPDAPLHIHVAEQVREVEDCIAWSGLRPVEWLLGNCAVDSRWCLVHATHLSDGEALSLARSGAVVGLCPITEANLGDGIFPLHQHIVADGGYAIGSDSNVLVDCLEELRLLEYGQRLQRRERNVIAGAPGRSTGAELHRAVVLGGAQALGVQGGLAPGASADMVSLDLQHPSLLARSGNGLLDALIFAAGRAAVDAVWRRGERVVTEGRHRDRDAIVSDYRKAVASLLR